MEGLNGNENFDAHFEFQKLTFTMSSLGFLKTLSLKKKKEKKDKPKQEVVCRNRCPSHKASYKSR